MSLDLTKPFTNQDVANLLASKDDTQHRQLRVTKAGMAYLSDDVGNIDTDGLSFRLETWLAGNGYTGSGAATNTGFVATIERVLRDNWPEPSSTYIDHF